MTITNKITISAFGCWNTGCDEDSGQKSVSDVIKEKESNYNFMIILGDNYYPKKYVLNKKPKYKVKDIQSLKMEKGFKCIDNINLIRKLIMGNHDIEESVNQGCSVIKYQQKLPWYDVKFPFGYEYHYIKNDDSYETVLIFYLDTTIYKINVLPNCYLEILNKTVDKLITEQNNFITTTLQKAVENTHINLKKVLFCGHEPLYTIYEEDESVIKSTNDNLLEHLFKEYKKYRDLNFTWICADYHVYQNTKITHDNLIINQFILGTGGAKLDTLPITNKSEYIKDDNKYEFNILSNIIYNVDGENISSNHQSLGLSAFGYGEIVIEIGKIISHKFILTKLPVLAGGDVNYKQKYLKYKFKYDKLLKKK